MLANSSSIAGRRSPNPNKPHVTYEVFRDFYLDSLQGSFKEDVLLGHWNSLHAGTGAKMFNHKAFISTIEFRKIMTSEGERLTEEEVEEMLRECIPDEEGRIFYGRMILLLLRK